MWIGGAAILLSNVGVIAATHILRIDQNNSTTALFVLGLGNLVAAVPIFFRTGSRPTQINLPRRTTMLPLILWALCNAMTYAGFVLFPTLLNASHVVIAEIIAPFVALLPFIRRHQKPSALEITTGIGAMLTLFAIVFSQRVTEQGNSSTILLFGVIVLLFAIAQSAARRLATLMPPEWTQPRLCALVAILILASAACISTPHDALRFSVGTGLRIFALGFIIAGTQWTFIFGLARSSALVSTMGIGTSVPLVVIFDACTSTKTNFGLPLILSLWYFVMSIWTAKAFAKLASTEEPKESRSIGGST